MADLGIDLLVNPKKCSPGSVASLSMSHKSSASRGSSMLSEDALDKHNGRRRRESKPAGKESHGHRHGHKARAPSSAASSVSRSRSSAASDTASESGSYASGTSSGSGSYSSFSGSDSGSYVSSSSGGSSSSSRSGGRPKRMSQEDMINAKRELLYQFDRLEKRGVPLPKKFTLASSLDEMKVEFERLKKERELDISVRFQKRMIMTVVTGLEFFNSKFNPMDVRLDGWSENVNESIDDYDEILEDLAAKYKGKSNMPPELRLMFALGGSAFMFHLKKTMLSSQLPGLDQMMQQQQPRAAAAPAGGGLGGLGGLMGGLGGLGGLGSMLGGLGSLFGGGGGGAGAGGAAMAAAMPPMQPAADVPRQPMRGPSNVDDILRELEQQQAQQQADQRVELLSTISESDISDIPDDVSVNNVLQTKRRAAAQRRTLHI